MRTRHDLISVAAALLASGAHAAPPVLSHIEIIPLHDGINTVEHFAADGRAATIVQAWRDNGNAHGHTVWLVMLRPQKKTGLDTPAGVVAFEDGDDALEDTISASPFDGERVLQTVVFAKALVDGALATVVIRADLGESASGVLADHAPAAISLYRLETPGVDVGTTPDVFTLFEKTPATGRFCNADMALHTLLQLPLPAGYAGGKAPDGCS
jgi:hypothetical protein